MQQLILIARLTTPRASCPNRQSRFFFLSWRFGLNGWLVGQPNQLIEKGIGPEHDQPSPAGAEDQEGDRSWEGSKKQKRGRGGGWWGRLRGRGRLWLRWGQQSDCPRSGNIVKVEEDGEGERGRRAALLNWDGDYSHFQRDEVPPKTVLSHLADIRK